MFVCPECGAAQPGPGACPSDRWPLAPAGDDVLLGTTIGAYRVARLLGVGGMGRVYKGVHPQIGSRVAVKVLSRECSDRRDLVERFFAEARAVNLIRHEGIVNVLDLASLPDGRPYIIMEYLDGAPLAAAIEGVAHTGPLPLGSVARLAVEVLDALSAAHAKGIVHRDLKPDNVFVTPSGRPKVLDFGIAKLLPELGGSYTQTGSLLGTPHYMAPEQAAGRPVDHRTDLYAMGVILFECVTGTKPFHGDSLFDLLRQHVDAAPPLPSMIRPGLPPAFEHVILTALAKAPEHRWPSADAMSTALQQATSTLSPDQWAPLAAAGGAGARTPSAAGWDSTGGRWAHTPHGAPAGQPHPTTISGQAGAAPRRSASKLWVALTAFVVVGGAAATIAATRGSGGTSTTASAPTGATSSAGSAATPTRPAGTGSSPSNVPMIANVPAASRPPSLVPATDGSAARAGSWIKFQALALPGWDPTHVDVDGFLAWADRMARQAIPDAKLLRIDANGVFPDGHADLTLSGSGYVSVRFVSPSRSQRDPSVPIGAQPNWHCMFQVMATVQTGPFITPMDGTSCEDEQPQPAPRCDTRGVWKQMIARKAPGGNAVAQIGYWSSDKGKPAMWYGSVEGAFSERFPDACP